MLGEGEKENLELSKEPFLKKKSENFKFEEEKPKKIQKNVSFLNLNSFSLISIEKRVLLSFYPMAKSTYRVK